MRIHKGILGLKELNLYSLGNYVFIFVGTGSSWKPCDGFPGKHVMFADGATVYVPTCDWVKEVNAYCKLLPTILIYK